MSFLKISDPNKRDTIVSEYLRLKKSIQQQSLDERLDNIGLQRDLTKLYKPITDSQSGLASQLAAIKDATSETTAALQALPSQLKAITFPQYPSIQAFEEPAEPSQTINLGDIATRYLQQYASNKNTVDTTFGIYSKNGQFYIGTLPITLQGDDIKVGDKIYNGTPGLWELLTLKHPDKAIYSQADRENYAEILNKTDAIRSSSNPSKPRSSRSTKYTTIIKPIWDQLSKDGKLEYRGPTAQLSPTQEPHGSGVNTTVILPSDPNELIRMLSLRLAGIRVGNTGVLNEAVAICDELLRQGVLNENQYKALMLQLS